MVTTMTDVWFGPGKKGLPPRRSNLEPTKVDLHRLVAQAMETDMPKEKDPYLMEIAEALAAPDIVADDAYDVLVELANNLPLVQKLQLHAVALGLQKKFDDAD